jgi:hypothetical protein
VCRTSPLHLLDQPAPRVSGRTLAGEATLRCLGPVAAAVDEAPADARGRPVRVDTAAATVPRCVGATSGGETSASASSKARAASSDGYLRARRRPEASRQRTSQPPRWKLALTGTSRLLSRMPDGRTQWTYLSRDNRTSTAGRNLRSAPEHQKAQHVQGFPSAPERTRTSTDHTVHKALNLVPGV